MNNLLFVLQSTTVFSAIAFILLLIATCIVAKKDPSKLYAIGTITIIVGIFLFVVYGIHTFDNIQKWGRDSSWTVVIPTLRQSFSSLLWASVVYLISRILYIIRTPRI